MNKRHGFSTIELMIVLILLSVISGLVLLNNTAIVNFAQYRMTKQINMSKTIYSTFGDLTHLSNILDITPIKTGTTVYLWYTNPKDTQDPVKYVNTKYITDVSIGEDFITATIDLRLLEGVPLCVDNKGKLVECFKQQTNTPTVNKLTIRRFTTSYPIVNNISRTKITFTAPFLTIWDQLNQRWVPCTNTVETEAVSNSEVLPIATFIKLTGSDTVTIQTGTTTRTACKSLLISDVDPELANKYFFILPAIAYDTAITNAIIIEIK